MATEKRLIDANALEAKMGGLCDEFGTDHLFIDAIVYEIGNAPTVDAVEVVHGQWKYGTRAAVCSECGFERSLDDNFGAAIACPDCGAKMDK